ncbi:MAG: PD-(D/E)XK nuclease family protein [Verrucomicrobiaceae bacterium]|nr:PD-(D/E)XK nuclease family protein [Verrucomicrobiaceae bacterium]
MDLLGKVNALNECHIKRVSAWVQDHAAVLLAHRHAECMRKRNVELGFNLFHLISEVYYRENLHSDIISAILDPSGSHRRGDHFLRLFLSFLQEHHGVTLSPQSYANARMFREAGKIDLLICDESSKAAIIIENKINGAADMDRQLVRYLEKVTVDWGYTCNAIVYLCLNHKKLPETLGWREEEREKVMALLRPVAAYDESEHDLYHGWLTPCVESSDGEVAHVIHQYRQLILKLGRNTMNKPIMSDFYNLMQDQKNHDVAVGLNAMWNDLPAFRCQRVIDAFMHDVAPFKKLWCCQSTVAVFEYLGPEAANIKLHVDCSSNASTTLLFWNNNDNDPEGKLPSQIVRDSGASDWFTGNNGSGGLTKTFEFPSQERELYQFIRDFKSALKARQSTTG